MEIVSIPIITAAVLAIVQYLKNAFNNNAKLLSQIPIIAPILGGLLGVIIYFCAPQFIIADNVFAAIVIGIVSGATAVDAHQVKKQSDNYKELLTTKDVEKKDTEQKDETNN